LIRSTVASMRGEPVLNRVNTCVTSGTSAAANIMA
jgi:hypothetical protein